MDADCAGYSVWGTDCFDSIDNDGDGNTDCTVQSVTPIVLVRFILR